MQTWQRITTAAALAACLTLPALPSFAQSSARAQRSAQAASSDARTELLRGIRQVIQERDEAMQEARREEGGRLGPEDREQLTQRFEKRLEQVVDRYEQNAGTGAAGAGSVYGYNQPEPQGERARHVWRREQLARINGQLAEEQEKHRNRLEQLDEFAEEGDGDDSRRVRQLKEQERDRHSNAVARLEERREELRGQIEQTRGQARSTGADRGRSTAETLEALQEQIEREQGFESSRD